MAEILRPVCHIDVDQRSNDSLFAGWGIAALVAKLMVDSALFVLSYIVQKKVVFRVEGGGHQ